MIDIALWSFIAVAAVVLATACTQAVVGFGFALLTVPIMMQIVGLQRADEMPCQGQVCQCLNFGNPFLNVVLAEMPEPRGMGFTDGRHRLELGDRDEGDAGRRPAGALCGITHGTDGGQRLVADRRWILRPS